jgi:hypothetical protein
MRLLSACKVGLSLSNAFIYGYWSSGLHDLTATAKYGMSFVKRG